MTIRTIFAPIAFEETAAVVVDAALTLAKALHGHVMASHVRQRFEYYPPIAYYPMPFDVSASASEAQSEAASAFARSLRAVFEERCDAAGAHIVPLSEALKQNGVTASWTDTTGMPPTEYGRAARVADLSVIALPSSSAQLETNLFESLLMESGAPVLLVPRDGLGASPKRILIAWDGSLEAARALRAARPFISDKAEATVMTIGHEDFGTPDVEAARGWVERSGGRANDKTIDWPKGPIAERILNQAEAANADLVVLGGYSHSRMHEALLGGVTRHMIEHADRAVLMMH